MIKKKISIIVLAGILSAAAVFGGCGTGAGNPSGEVTQEIMETTQTQESSSEPETKEEESSEALETSKEIEETKPEEPKEPFVSDRSEAFELLSNINIGWNLGNTLDAHGAGASVASETFWGNPKTTQEMFDAVAEQGFQAVRIPVTFAEHVDTINGYAIKEQWMNRVQEVVDYALNAGLYVIVDTHHEPDFWLKPDSDHEEKCLAELSAIWTQVAERFKDYDEKLIFEGMNEPRMKGSANEWNGGSAGERKVIDKLNQAFVDAVRATGGNNENRLLIICAYGNNAGYNVLKELKIPEDNHIAVAVHMYTPYQFTYDTQDGGYSAWDGSQKASIINTLKQIDKYLIQKDVPVVVTEFGAVDKENEADIIAWIEDYLGAMNKYNIKCFWWDNNLYHSTGENFGIFDRKNLSWYNKKIADALISNAVSE